MLKYTLIAVNYPQRAWWLAEQAQQVLMECEKGSAIQGMAEEARVVFVTHILNEALLRRIKQLNKPVFVLSTKADIEQSDMWPKWIPAEECIAMDTARGKKRLREVLKQY
jgi:hypothetical protein